MASSSEHSWAYILHFTNGHWWIASFPSSYFQSLIFEFFAFQLQFHFEVVIAFFVCSWWFLLWACGAICLRIALDSSPVLILSLGFSSGVPPDFAVLAFLFQDDDFLLPDFVASRHSVQLPLDRATLWAGRVDLVHSPPSSANQQHLHPDCYHSCWFPDPTLAGAAASPVDILAGTGLHLINFHYRLGFASVFSSIVSKLYELSSAQLLFSLPHFGSLIRSFLSVL